MYRFMGDDLVTQIQALPPQTLKSLNAEFEKITVLPQNERGRTAIKFQNEAAGAMTASQFNNDQLPRADISQWIAPVIKKLADVQW